MADKPNGRPPKLTADFIAAAQEVIDEGNNALIYTDEELLFAINEKLTPEARISKSSFEKSKSGSVEDDAIVAGDLNAPRTGQAIQRLRGKHDIDEDLFQTGDAGWFNNKRLEERWTYIFEGRRQQIDHILMSYSVRDACKIGNSYRIQTDTLNVTETLPGGKLASDHRPFFVDFQFRE